MDCPSGQIKSSLGQCTCCLPVYVDCYHFIRCGTSHLPVRLSVQVDIYYPIPSHCGVYCSSFHLVMLPLMVLFVPLHHLTDKNCRKMSYLAGRFYIDWWYEQFTVLINWLFFVKLMSWKDWQIPLKSSIVKCGLL